MIDYEKIGARIAEERKIVRHVSQRKMAEDLLMYQADISNLEKAKSGSGITDLSKLDMIAEYFAIPLEDLIFGKKTDSMLKYLGKDVQLKEVLDFQISEKQQEQLKVIMGKDVTFESAVVYCYSDFSIISILEIQTEMADEPWKAGRLHKLHSFVFYKDELAALMVTNLTSITDHVYQPAFEKLRELLQSDVFDVADTLTVLNPYWALCNYADDDTDKVPKTMMYRRMNALKKMDVHRSVLYIESVYVREDYRRHGIFRMYIDFLKNWIPESMLWLSLQPTSGDEAEHEYGYLPEYSVSEVGQININAAIAEKVGFIIDPRSTSVPSETIDSDGNTVIKPINVRRAAYYLPKDIVELTKDDAEILSSAFTLDAVANHFFEDNKFVDVYHGSWREHGFIMAVKMKTPAGNVFAYTRGKTSDDIRFGISRKNPAPSGEEVDNIESYSSLEEAKDSKYYDGLELTYKLYQCIFFSADPPNLTPYMKKMHIKG